MNRHDLAATFGATTVATVRRGSRPTTPWKRALPRCELVEHGTFLAAGRFLAQIGTSGCPKRDRKRRKAAPPQPAPGDHKDGYISAILLLQSDL